MEYSFLAQMHLIFVKNCALLITGIGIGIFNDNIDENQTTTNHHGLQDQGMRPSHYCQHENRSLNQHENRSLDELMVNKNLRRDSQYEAIDRAEEIRSAAELRQQALRAARVRTPIQSLTDGSRIVSPKTLVRPLCCDLLDSASLSVQDADEGQLGYTSVHRRY